MDKTDFELAAESDLGKEIMEAGDAAIMEAVLTPNSTAEGKTARRLNLR